MTSPLPDPDPAIHQFRMTHAKRWIAESSLVKTGNDDWAYAAFPTALLTCSRAKPAVVA
jgi:hypothetical protein